MHYIRAQIQRCSQTWATTYPIAAAHRIALLPGALQVVAEYVVKIIQIFDCKVRDQEAAIGTCSSAKHTSIQL